MNTTVWSRQAHISLAVDTTHTLLPESRAMLQRIGPHWQLGPMDHLAHPWVPVAVVFVYSQPISTRRLKRALELLLNYYPHLCGRLDMRTKPGIDLAGALAGETGAHLLEATCNGQLDNYSSESSGRSLHS